MSIQRFIVSHNSTPVASSQLPSQIPPPSRIVRLQNFFPVADLLNQRVDALVQIPEPPPRGIPRRVRADHAPQPVRLTLEPPGVVQRLHRVLQLAEISGSSAAVHEHRVDQVVPRRPSFTLREYVLRVVPVAEERRVPLLARLHAVLIPVAGVTAVVGALACEENTTSV